MKNNKFYISAILAAMFLGMNNSYNMEQITREDILNYKKNPEKILGKETTGDLLNLFIPNKDNKYKFEIGELVVVPRSSGKLTYGILMETKEETKAKGLIRVQLENGIVKDLPPKLLYKSIASEPETIKINGKVFKIGQEIDKQTVRSIASFSADNEFNKNEWVIVSFSSATVVNYAPSMESAKFYLGMVASSQKQRNKYEVMAGVPGLISTYFILPEFLGKIKK